jgi:hypothetical protein
MDRLSAREATLSSTRVAARVFTSVFVLCVLSTALPAQEAPKTESSPPRWRLRGCAIDDEGKPIAGAAIAIGGEALTTADALANPHARSDAHGCFEVDFAEAARGEQLRILLGE